MKCITCGLPSFRDNLCISCYKKHQRNERDRRFNRNNPAKYLHRTAKKRAKEMGWEFNITVQDIEDVMVDKCPILRIPLVVNPKKHDWNSYSLDRLDSEKGYVRGNIGVLSWRANYIKNNFSLEEVERLLKYMKKELVN